MARQRTKKPKQAFLSEDLAPPIIKPIEDAADTYYDVMVERCKLSKEEDEAKDNLIDKMKEHGVERYVTRDGKVVTVTNKSNVRVKKKDEETNGDGGDE
jgi:hypothetical protein